MCTLYTASTGLLSAANIEEFSSNMLKVTPSQSHECVYVFGLISNFLDNKLPATVMTHDVH